MGQLFDSRNFTNPGTGLIDPNSGQTVGVGTPSQILNQTRDALNQNFTPQLDSSGQFTNNQNQPLPSIGNPSIRAAESAGGFTSPGLSKSGKLMTILQSTMQGGLAGRAASENALLQSGGRRSAGVGTGFQAGVAFPWQQEQMQQQVQLGRAGLQPIETPYGPMPAELATKSMLPWMIKEQGAQNVADINAGARTQAAQIGANAGIQKQQLANANRLDVVGLQTAIAANKGAKYIPDVDAQGQPFYHVMNPYNQEIGRTDANVIPSLMSRTSNTIDYQTLDDGSIVALPKTTTTTPNVPGRATPARAAGNSAAPRVVTDASGNPLVAKGTTTSTTRTMVESAPGVIDLAEKMRGQIAALNQSGALGPGMSRWNDFWSGKVGTDNPQFRAMMTNADLLSSLLQKMHQGSRGGQEVVARFSNMIGAGHQSAANMVSALDQIEDYAHEVQTRAPKATRSAAPVTQQGQATHIWTPNGLQPVVPH